MAVETSVAFLERTNIGTQAAFQELFAYPDRPWSHDPFEVLYDERNQRAMRQIIRWQGSNIEVPDGVQETDWDHQIDMWDIFHEEIIPQYAGLRSEVDIDVVHGIIMTHDEAEIIAGDLWFGINDPELRKRKIHKETVAARYFRRQLPEPAGSTLFGYYERYVARDPKDKEALLTKWLDCVQANRFALKHSLYATIQDPEVRVVHITGAAHEFLKWSNNFMRAFDSEEAKLDLQQLRDNEIQRFIDAGYGKEIFLMLEN